MKGDFVKSDESAQLFDLVAVFKFNLMSFNSINNIHQNTVKFTDPFHSPLYSTKHVIVWARPLIIVITNTAIRKSARFSQLKILQGCRMKNT